MSYLSQATKPTSEPPMITIIGAPGAGKTSLAAMFPSPIFMQAETASTVFETWAEEDQPMMLPLIPADNASTVVLDQLRELVTADHEFKTLVIDSVTSLSSKYEREIIKKYQCENIGEAAGGYGKGFLELAAMHAKLIDSLDILRKRKRMAIVMLAHIGTEKIKGSPEDASEFTVYGMDMHRQSAGLYVANSDAVVYLQKDRHIVGAESDKKGRVVKSGRATETGERKIITTGDGRFGYVGAKNRYGMPDEISVEPGENPILQYIKFFNHAATEVQS